MTVSRYDLHAHSTASDGSLSPGELVQRACDHGVEFLALTDHDTTAGLVEAMAAAQHTSLRLIPGIELSALWQKRCFHIIGLNIDQNYPPLLEGTHKMRQIRIDRAVEIGERLAKKKIIGAYEGALALAGDGMITRTHFALYLRSQGHVDEMQEAFDRYLGQGKPGFVPTRWSAMSETIEWITGAGGVAVMAHPLRYRLTGAWLRRLLGAFKEAGGEGIEVIGGNSTADNIRTAADQARRFGLLGSVGSDFHNPEKKWVELGRLAPLPDDIQPVWSLWPEPALQSTVNPAVN